jgi:spore coat protein B
VNHVFWFLKPGSKANKHIQINRGGPEKLDGILAEISSDNVLLIVDRELVRIPTNKNGSGGNKSGRDG